MNWVYKALIQGALSRLPLGQRVNHLLQRHVTRSLPIGPVRFAEVVASARGHLDRLAPHLTRPLGESVFYEFGAGYDLAIPLAYWAAGVERQVLVDIQMLL